MNNRIVLTALFAWVFSGWVHADDAQTLAKIDQQLKQVQSFEFGQSGNPAQDLERTLFQLPADSALRAEVEQKLIDALDGANNVGRGVICRQLRVVGTDRCVPAVAKLLSDEDASAFARYTLQGLGSETALGAMHEALHDVPDNLKLGILNSLSARGYEPMLKDCVDLIESKDDNVATAAARALGRLGGPRAISTLADRRANASATLAAEIDLALLGCAEQLLAGGKTDSAAKIYQQLYGRDGFQLAGLKGLVAARPDDAASLLVGAMRKEDARLAAFAANSTRLVPGNEATAAFVSTLDMLPEGTAVVLIKALGERGDAAAAPAIAAASKSPSREVRFAALAALGGLEGNDAADALLGSAMDDDPTVRSLARASLAKIRGVNSYLATMAQGGNEDRAVEAIAAFASRGATDQNKLLFALARSENAKKRVAAINALGVIGDSTTVGQLVELLLASGNAEDLASIEASLGRVLGRISDADERAEVLLTAMPRASGAAKPALVRLLARAGTTDALDAARRSLKDADAAVRVGAVESLASWPNSDAADDLVPLIENAASAELKRVALDGYVRIASESEDPASMFLGLLDRIRSVDSKKVVLNEIGLNCESFEALDATMSLFGNPQLKAVAGIAAIRIAYKLRRQHRDRIREVLHEILARVDHPDVQRRGQDVINDLDKYEDHILRWVAIGPFVDNEITSGEVSYKTVFAPERSDTSDLKWKPLTLGIGSWDINLESTYGAKDHCSAFVRTMIWSPVDQSVQVEGGADDALKIWVNGKLVHEGWRTGGCEPRQIKVPTKLTKGWNELKLKVTDHEGGWQFGCRVRKPNGTKVDDLKYEAR